MSNYMLFTAIAIVIFTLMFDFINGFHDTANSIATCVATRSLKPSQAIMMAASLDFLGAIFFTEVAKTIGTGIVVSEMISIGVLFAAVVSAIFWNLFTWYCGIPSSSSHALIGGLVGAAVIKSYSFGVVIWKGLIFKIILPLFLAPIIGFIAGYSFMILLMRILKPFKPAFINTLFLKFQIFSSALVAFSHGANDAQKSMGIITLTLLSTGMINEFEVPLWVKFSCALALALGTALGGKKIIKTMGNKICKLRPVSGFAAQTSTALVIFSATLFGAPISTTHIISSSIMGVGTTKSLSNVRWKVAVDMVYAWIVTIPACAILSGILFKLITLF